MALYGQFQVISGAKCGKSVATMVLCGMETRSSIIQRIALVDDEASLRATLRLILEGASYSVSDYPDGLSAWNAFALELPDLAILDVSMPRMDGLDLCRRLRSHSPHLPIIFLSSRDEEIDKVLGLELGGDDYITKPFSGRELLARINVLKRRLQGPSSEGGHTRRGDLSLDSERCEVLWKGKPIHLTVSEFRMLQVLVAMPGHVKNRDQLQNAAYGSDSFASDRTVDTHIKRMRRKFEALDPDFSALEAVHGLGYRYRTSP